MNAQADRPPQLLASHKYKCRALTIHDTVSGDPCDYKARRERDYSCRRGITTPRIIICPTRDTSSNSNSVEHDRWCSQNTVVREKRWINGESAFCPRRNGNDYNANRTPSAGKYLKYKYSKYVF